MNTRDTKSGANGEREWGDDPRLLAYALGELEPAQTAELEVELAADDVARAEVAKLRAFAETLAEHFAAEQVSELTDSQREAIVARLSGAAPNPSAGPSAMPDVLPAPTRARGVRARQYAAIAATLLVVGVGGWAFYRMRGLGDVGSHDYVGSSGHVIGCRISRKTSWPASISETLGRTLESSYDEYSAGEPELFDAEVDLQALGYTAGRIRVRHGDRMEWQLEGKLQRQDDFQPPATPSNREAYERIYENPFQLPQSAPYSTFSIDVDTASYANVRRMIQDGHLPPPDAVRIEELVNYFPYAYAAPQGEHPFSVDVEVGSAPWSPRHRLVRIALKGRPTLAAQRRATNLVFLLDVSGSMAGEDKLPLLKRALHMLVQELDERDKVSIVVYAGASGLALPPTRCDQSVNVHMALERLNAGGSTNGGAGIELAYRVAAENFVDGGINRVLLATDGDFNVGISDDGSLVRLIEEKAKGGVFLSVLGFGTGNLQDAKMEKLADKGNGHYAYIDSLMEARKVLVEQLGSTLETIAKDVKIQVEFNPAEVRAYRLIGYENRLLAAQDFNDDAKDAGEIGAGHCVTALYEVVPTGVELDVPGLDPLRYQTPAAPAGPAFSGELMNLKLRYKQPEGDTSILLATPVRDAGLDFQELGADTRWAATVAAFGMVLRDSRYRGTATLDDVSRWALESAGEDPDGYRAQFIGLVGQAKGLRAR
jgi:Ca-activated chloride channel family protein